MQAIEWTRRVAPSDGLEPLAPTPAHVALRPAVWGAPAPLLWVAAGILATVGLRLVEAGPEVVAAFAATAALIYLGTAAISGSRVAAALDSAAAVLAVGLVVAGPGPAEATLMVHALWGVLRASLRDAPPGRSFARNWAAFHATASLLLSLSA